MGDLSPHFSTWEFRCHCLRCGLRDVDRALVEGLEELRALLGHAPITVDSGVRCYRRNKDIGGSPKSQHLPRPTGEPRNGDSPWCVGCAADIRVRGASVRKMFAAAEQVEAFHNGGIGVYPREGFIHVDVRGYQARWGRRDGWYVGPMAALEGYP